MGVQSGNRGALIIRREVGIAQGHFDIFVAKKFFDRDEVHPRHDEVGGEGMAEIMEDTPANPGCREGPAEPFPNIDQGMPGLAREDIVRIQTAWDTLESGP
jgi:hypothetical protein